MSSLPIAPEDRTMASLTHLSGLAGYVVPFAGVLVPIIIWIVRSDSKVISSIAKQALLLNLVAFLLFCASWILFLTLILIPLVFVFWMVLGFAAFALPIVGAIKANTGEYYKYPMVGVEPI